jgi:hypothetical protein
MGGFAPRTHLLMEICIPHHPFEKRAEECRFPFSGSAAAKTAPHFSPRVANELVNSLVVFCGLFSPLVLKTAL